jgi:hypothetical protein
LPASARSWPSFSHCLPAAFAAAPVSPCAKSMSRDCSRVCNARTSRPSPWSLASGHALYNVSWNRSSGMNPVCGTTVSGWSPASTLTRRPSAALTNRARPRAACRPSLPRGNGWVIAARWTTASSVCISAIALPAFSVCWTVNSTCPKSGPMIPCAEKKLHSRRSCVPHQAADRLGDGGAHFGPRRARPGLDVR